MSGLFGVVTAQGCVEDLFYGTDYLSHMGTEYGGMAVIDRCRAGNGRIIRRIRSIAQAQFKSKFYDDYKEMVGNYGVGVISDKDEQPIFLNTKFGPLAICTAGLIENNKELIDGLLKDGISFTETTDGHSNATEIIGKLISQGDTIANGIKKMFSMIKGSCTLLLLSRKGVYAARDRYGHVPLIAGARNGDWAVTNETSSFSNLGFEIKKYLSPGEIILINDKGMETISRGREDINQICAFMWIYTGFPTSSYEGISVESVRERCGRFLARRDNIKADIVAGVPDSGVAHAIGYAMESGISYRRPLVKYSPGYGRSYTPPSQEIRDQVARMKLNPVKEIVNGNRIIICEDSIVRGTQLRNFTIKKLWDTGAREVHVRVACPPLMFPCRFCLSTRSINELATRRTIKDMEGKDIEDVGPYLSWRSPEYKNMIEWIRKDIGVTSLVYQRMDDMVAAIGVPAEKLCLYCWTGQSINKV